jgi:hypothetical protein
MKNRYLFEIAEDIYKNWSNIYFGAIPYLHAMMQLRDINDKYLYDDASSVVRYFLSNASSFRGPMAKQLKNELKQLLNEK